jgi:hypothetical protein
MTQARSQVILCRFGIMLGQMIDSSTPGDHDGPNPQVRRQGWVRHGRYTPTTDPGLDEDRGLGPWWALRARPPGNTPMGPAMAMEGSRYLSLEEGMV